MQILTKSFCVSGLKALVPASTAFHGIFLSFLHFYIHVYGAVEQHTYLWVGPSISGITNTGMGFTAGWCWHIYIIYIIYQKLRRPLGPNFYFAALRASLTLSFAPFERSGRVTHATMH